MEQNDKSTTQKILDIIPIFEKGLVAPLEDISPELLNNQISSHKMSIGQIAIHCTGWMTYFLSDPKPWEPVKWTCKPVTYPLEIQQVEETIDEGFTTLRNTLNTITDTQLDVIEGQKGPGYIILRLLHHINAHSNQMSYLRQLEDPQWSFGSHFGDMATALIGLEYSTTRDYEIQGF